MRTSVKLQIIGYSVLCAVIAAVILRPPTLGPQRSTASPKPATEDVIYLTGVVRDFQSSHPDFGITDVAQMGHYAGNVALTLGNDGLPDYWFTGSGKKITSQWYDKNGNPIMPYANPQGGLPGGHFDVDVYNAATTKPKYHCHEFDDKYDVNYLDIVNDPKLLFKTIIPATYPNNVRLEFHNVNKGGGGSYEFKAGTTELSGVTANGFPPQVFKPSQLSKLKITMIALSKMRGTTPGTSQKNVATRDGALSIRMYDTVTNKLVYEMATYHHGKETATVETDPTVTKDTCGVALNDTPGIFGADGRGAISGDQSFSTWYTDELGTNLSTQHTIALTKNNQGIYEYMTNEFYPIDEVMFGNEGQAHNSLFTYTISATFIYKKCTGQFFEFQGNDDCWVFINGEMVMDIGGVNTPSRQYIALDRLKLTDGQQFTLDFFYANRRVTPTSLFHMRTNLELFTPSVHSVTGGYD